MIICEHQCPQNLRFLDKRFKLDSALVLQGLLFQKIFHESFSTKVVAADFLDEFHLQLLLAGTER